MSANNSLDTQQQVVRKEVKYFCKPCDFETFNKKSLYNHKQSIHVRRTYTCPECNKEFTWKAALILHRKSLHFGIKHACKLCDYQATGKGNCQNPTQLNSTRNNSKVTSVGVRHSSQVFHPTPPTTTNFSATSRPARELKFGTDTH